MMHKLLTRVAHLVTRRPGYIVCLALVLTAASITWSAARLVTHTDQDDLVSESLDYHRQYKDFLRDFGDQEYLYILIDAQADGTVARQFSNNLTARIAALPHVTEVISRIDPALVRGTALLHTPPETLKALEALVATHPKSAQQLLRARGLSDMLAIGNAGSMQGGAWTSSPVAEQGFSVFRTILEDLNRAARGEPTTDALEKFSAIESAIPITEDGYLKVGNTRYLLVLIMPEKNYSTLEVIAKPLADIRAALDTTRREFPDVVAGLTGRPVLAADEMQITQRDMTRATILAFGAVLCLLIVCFRRLANPLLVGCALAMGMSWTYGWATLTIGSLNLLSSVFAIILVGAGFEFGLHLIARYREEIAHGASALDATTTTITETGRGNLTAALTTTAAFFAALFTDFLALRELGVIAGGGILLCLLSMLTVLPAMLVLKDRSRSITGTPRRTVTLPDHLWRPAWRRPIIIVGCCITLGLLPGLWHLRIDHNLLNLQAQGLESVEFEHRLIQEHNASTWQAVGFTKTPTQANALARTLAALPEVGSADAIGSLLPERVNEKLGSIASIKKALGPLDLMSTASPLRAPTLLSALTTLRNSLEHLADQALRGGKVEAVQAVEGLVSQVDELRSHLRSGNPKVLSRLVDRHAELLQTFFSYRDLFIAGLDPELHSLHSLPEAFRRRYIGRSGRFAVYVYPTQDIWDPEKLETFVSAIRRVDPQITGVPIEVYESSRLLERSFQQVSLLALAAIGCIVFFMFHTMSHRVIAFAPLGIGLMWLFGLMGYFGIPFTPANFFAIPILIGLGIDSGAQLAHRIAQEGGYHRSILQGSTGVGILLTGLTTLIAFGMLMTAAHRGLAGLGLIMALGSLTILVAAIFFVPAFLTQKADPALRIPLRVHDRR